MTERAQRFRFDAIRSGSAFIEFHNPDTGLRITYLVHVL